MLQMRRITISEFAFICAFGLSHVFLFTSAQLCNIFCDGRNSSEANNPEEVSKGEIFNRKLRLFVSEEDKMAFAEISDGDPTDEVWIDRSFDTGISWDAKLGTSFIPSGSRSIRTVMFNTEKPWNGKFIRGSLRVCGKAGNRENIACTPWYRSPPPNIYNYTFRQATSVELFGRKITLFISDVDKVAYAQISNGDPTDEVWIDRSFDGGKGWEGRLGFAVTQQYLREAKTDIFNTENMANGQRGMLRACGKAGDKDDVACTSWTEQINLHMFITTTSISVIKPDRDTSNTSDENNNPTDNKNDSSSSEGSSEVNTWLIVASLILLAVILLIALVVFMYRRQTKIERVLSDQEAKVFFYGLTQRMSQNVFAHENVDSFAYNKETCEIKKSEFFVDWNAKLGSGSSGLVLKGTVRNMEVAVKTTRDSMDIGSQLRSLLSEIKVLQHIGQCDNIVNMVGSNTSKLQEGKVYLFLEYCPLGSLDKYLRAHKSMFRPDFKHNVLVDVNKDGSSNLESYLTLTDLLNWSLQITNAMRYLQMKKVIHADLATRNVLLLRRDCAKLTDFGLSRRLNEYSSYVKKHQEPLPWRHMAIESLKELSFSHQSDVWSLGIVFWEIFSLGDVPYPGYSWTPEFIKLLEDNLRPYKPDYAPDGVYSIMLDCWKPDPTSRPSFDDIHHRLWNNKNARDIVLAK